MAAADAQMYWMSAKIPSDQFLLYAFAGEPADVAEAADELARRAQACPQLRLRIVERRLAYPQWVPGVVGDDQIVIHPADGLTWQSCLDAVTRLAEDQLDLRRMAWRVHVFTPVHDAPDARGPVTVAVVQIAHAFADGIRSADLAGALFGRTATVSALTPHPRGNLIMRSLRAARAHRRLEDDTAAGLVPPPAEPRPALSVNRRPVGSRILRTLVRAKAALPGPTVTVGALAAISTALSDHLAARGEDASSLGAEVPMAKDGVPQAHNHFRNVGVGLYPAVADRDERARLIAADLDARRRRGAHPAFAAGDRAYAAVPAVLLRWGVKQFDADARSPVVTGNTVVSSVNRGAADLRFGGCLVLLTAGYPSLSPMMGLTHGVHGIGDTVAVSVHTDDSVMPDVDGYLDRLDAALRG
jgi:hypothetical protein